MPEPVRTPSWLRQFNASKSFMLKAINDEVTFNDFYDLMKSAGLSYRRTNMLTDFRNVQGLYKFEDLLDKLDPFKVIAQQYVTNEGHSVNYNYLAGVEYKYTDPFTGETITGIRMVDSETLSTKADYIERAESMFKEGAPYADPSARDFKLRFVLTRSP